MEAALLSGFIKCIVPKLSSLASEKYKLQKGMKDDIRFLEKELRMIHAAIDQSPASWMEEDGVQSLYMEDLRELAHHIEDCVDRLVFDVTRVKQRSSTWPVLAPLKNKLSTTSSLKFATELQRLRKRPDELKQRKERYDFAAAQSSSTQKEEAASSSSSGSDPRILDTDHPVGIDVPRDELQEQLAEVAEGQPKQLKVISIVGFSGSGKTVLAREVYNSQVGQQFSVRAWVCATGRDTKKLLVEILQDLGRPVEDNSEVNQLISDLKEYQEYLDKRRYLIVLDDIRLDQWIDMESAFPGDNDVSSRVMVTTTLQSVANMCSSANGYVHKMRRLGKEHSEELFFKKACSKEYSGYKGMDDSTEVLKKCDGQPLALVTVGQFLRTKGWPTEPKSEDACRQLGMQLEKDNTLRRMRRMLTGSYNSLTGHASKACLLYFGVFPGNHPVRRNNLTRRWLAEGFVDTQDLSCENFDNLIDRNIIEPIDIGKNDKVKTCQAYGMMREFILHKSTSQNFNTLLCTAASARKYVRRLSVYYNSAQSASCLDVDLKVVRSLTIFGEAGKAISDFQKYQLLRVLDLEECTDLGDDHLKYIWNLLLLKYLSLGSTVTSIPKSIQNLKLLETLDLRKTKAEILPVEVILLPRLIHLLGKFQISGEEKRISKLKLFLSGIQCNLETLAGFVTDQSLGFPQILSHMKKLRKVKIWCQRTASNTNLSALRHAIQNFIHDEMENSNEHRSLSLHLEVPCEVLLKDLKAPCYLRTLKLQGMLLELPQFVTSLRGLRELCLSSSKLTTGLLEALSELLYLQYLKLTADQLEDFIIKADAFPKLVRICFELQFPTLPKIEEGALSHLISLQLICKGLVGLSGMKIKYFRCIREVVLHPEVTPETSEAWKSAAREHSNRPKVLLLETISPTERQSRDNSVDPEPFKDETVETSCLVQPSSSNGLNCDFDDTGLPKGSISCAELSIVENMTVPSSAHAPSRL